MNTGEIARSIVSILEEKKGEDILLLDIQAVSDISDYFVICTGTSDRMLRALADAVTEGVRILYDRTGRTEGAAKDGWLLVDFGDVVLHLFAPETRDYYRLEELWSHARMLIHLQ